MDSVSVYIVHILRILYFQYSFVSKLKCCWSLINPLITSWLSKAEREKRDFNEKLEQERQAGIQALKKIEKVKRDYDRLQQESTGVVR